MHLLRKLKSLAALLLLGAMPALAQLPVKITDGTTKEIPMGAAGKQVTFYMQAITTGGVTVTANPIYAQVIYCANSTGGAVTLTMADTQGSPVTFLPAVSLAANSAVLIFSSQIGLYLQGIKLTAGSNSAITCQVQGVQ